MRFVVLLLVVMVSCSAEVAIPKNVMPLPKMEAVLYDILLADEMVDLNSLQDSTYKLWSRRLSFYDTIFHLHAIDKSTFQRSLQFYQSRPDLLQTLFDSLQRKPDTLSVKKLKIKPAA